MGTLKFRELGSWRQLMKILLWLQILRSVVGQLSSEEEQGQPCADFKAGDDDLQGYDFISRFRLDIPETQYPGVTRVRGSHRMQTAYRLDKEANLTVPTRYLCVLTTLTIIS
ncbi:collagen alpha-1(IX) chain-like [Photinus pyralis]|uniref:collagen alpha-1(IX) chain-like n=1 Tax=Photinus pyralis TaxID=7054 RepID=UPI001266F2D9|nr:collagen alpha-1(IX) chain-like [Photinus pyralis]